MESVDVLIVGAGPVGLSLAIELGQRGIGCRVIERNDRVGYSPRAKLTNVRTREHLRRWGIADALRRASPIRADYPTNAVFATRMSGPILARFEDTWSSGHQRNNLYSEPSQWVPQYTLEEVLRAHAVSLTGVEVRFDTVITTFEENHDGITSTIFHTPTDQRTEIRSRYLVGADGAKSTVRKGIDVQLVGDGGYSSNLNIVFRSHSLARRHGHGPAVMYWMINDEVPALLGPMSDDGLWYFIATKVDANADPAKLDLPALIKRSMGIDCDVEIVGTDPWIARRLMAERYSRGNVFLAGDSCHLHPPFGGFGMNMGVGDAVDLGWKMAATLQGWGGPDLLASYEWERRPVHEWAINEAVANYAMVGNQLVRPGLEAEGPVGEATRREVGETILAAKAREMRTLGVVKGYTYSGSPITVSDGSVAPVRQSMVYEPSAHPGCVAPHLWLDDGSSLYDHFGIGFSLLVADSRHGGEVDALRDAAESTRVPLKVLKLDDERLRARYQAPLALIRPDQHVAWRGSALPHNTAELLNTIRGASTIQAMRDLAS